MAARSCWALPSASRVPGADGAVPRGHDRADLPDLPIVSLSPVITILLSLLLLRERTGKLGVAGIALAVISLPLFDYSPDAGARDYGGWFLLAMLCMLAWGLQAYLIKLANATMSAESIFVYMMLSGLLFIPVAVCSPTSPGP